ncbi:hypothetical protein, partial [Subtercola vilae]|uniref:hypothetical protein n=1 Tax=Subtercola vilae TaxID=2056433 RepID=UPI001F3B88E0
MCGSQESLPGVERRLRDDVVYPTLDVQAGTQLRTQIIGRELQHGGRSSGRAGFQSISGVEASDSSWA